MHPSPGSAATSSLPPDLWTAPEIVEDVIVADGVTVHRAGISTIAPDGEEMCGSAADRSGPALARAQFELLERVCTIEAVRAPRPSYVVLGEGEQRIESRVHADVFPESDAPNRWRFARSNGIALHASWQEACRRALWELAERDRILRSWHGEILPERLTVSPELLPRTESYEWRAYSFPERRDDGFSRGVEVVGVFGFPTRDERPFAFGFGARPAMSDALECAIREAVQVLAFLWGEPAPASDPELQPTAMFHLDSFQVSGRHELVRRWLEGAHTSYAHDIARGRPSPGRVGYVDLTPEWLGRSGLRVAKAVCSDAVPLVFGESPFAKHLPREMRVHPIP